MRVLNFGSLNLDHTYTVDHFVQPAETMSVLNYQVNFGGKGHNQSIALAKAGVNTWHAGLVGQDGKSIKEHMNSYGVNTTYTQLINSPTGHAIIQVDKKGQNEIIVYAGANGCIDETYASTVLSNFGKGDMLLLQNEISCLPYIMQTAKRRGIKIILNPSPAGRTILSCPMDIVDIFVLNEVEGEALSGEKAPDRILAILKEKYTHAEFLLTLGKNGAVYASKQETIFKSIYSTKVVDTTAAGDTFTGYFFAWYLAGNTPEEALKVASMASSIAVSRPGAAASIPTKTEVLERLASL